MWIDIAQTEMKKTSHARENDCMQHIGANIYFWGEAVEKQKQHHDDAPRTDRCHSDEKACDQSDQCHPNERFHRGRRMMRNLLLDLSLEQQKHGDHDEENAYCDLDEVVYAIAVKRANVGEKAASANRTGNAANCQRDYGFAPHG